MKAKLPLWVWVLPACGVAAACYGAYLLYQAPRVTALASLRAEAERLDVRRINLTTLPVPSSDELADRLPQALTVGNLLARVEPLARQSGVRAVSFVLEDERTGPGPIEADPMFVDPGDSPLEAGAEADTLRCVLTVAGTYRDVVHFLGLIESSPTVMRVRTLLLQPTITEIRAEIGITAFWYAGEPMAAGAEVIDDLEAPPPPDGGR